MAIPRWLAVGLLAFLTCRQRELLQAGLAGAALLLSLVGFGYWLYLNRRSMQRSDMTRFRGVASFVGALGYFLRFGISSGEVQFYCKASSRDIFLSVAWFLESIATVALICELKPPPSLVATSM